MASPIGKVNIEAKIVIKVGEQQVELSELAQALTRAGVELQALIPPMAVGEVEIAACCSPLDDLRPGEGIFRDRDGKLRSIEVNSIAHTPNAFPKVEGHITGRI